MTPEWMAILGLFLGMWSQGVYRQYDRTGHRGYIWFALAVGVVSLALLIWAVIRAVRA